MSELAKGECKGNLDFIGYNCSGTNNIDSLPNKNLNENKFSQGNDYRYISIQEGVENVEDVEDKIRNEDNTTKAIGRRNADVEEVNRKLTNEGMQENVTLKPHNSSEFGVLALETPTTTSSPQQTITHTTDTMEGHVTMSNQNTAISSNFYSYDQKSNDKEITVNPEKTLDISSGIDINDRRKETEMMDIHESCVIKTQEAEQYQRQADNNAKPVFKRNDQEQSNEAVNVASKSLFDNKEFSDDKVNENLTTENNILEKYTERHSGLGTYQWISENHDYKGLSIKTPLTFQCDRNLKMKEIMIADNNVQSNEKSEKQDELWTNNHISISNFDRIETLETEIYSEEVCSNIDSILTSSENNTCKQTKDRNDSDHVVSDPINPMAKYCEFSQGNLNDKETYKIGTEGGESETFIETEENCNVCKSNQQGLEEEGTTKSLEITLNTLEFDDDYFSDKVNANGGIALSESNTIADNLYHANTDDTKLDTRNKIEIGQLKMESGTSAMKSFWKKNKRPNRDENELNVRKGTSVRDRNKQVSQTMINFGKRCESCLSTSFHNLNNDEIRCLNCFEFECLLCERQCSCGNTCYCKIIKKTIEEKLKQAKKILRESIYDRLPIEDTINIVSSHCYNLHNGKTILKMNLRLSRYFESQHKNISGNLIEILLLDYEDPSSRKYLPSQQAVYVNLKTVMDDKVIGIYSKDMTARKEKFINPLVRCLYSKGIQAQNVDAFSGKLEGKDAQLIVVCLVHSRVVSDVNADLCEIEDTLYKHIILVLLHFKQSDKRKCANELKLDRRFAEMAIIDLFQQPENNNTDQVYEKIIDAIKSYE